MVLADEESKSLWDYFDKSKLEGIDLIISCGDLDPRYLSFLATFTKAPVLYVHGNHDVTYDRVPPEGCICIDDQIYDFHGLRILGLGGSMRYKPGPYMYTEQEMEKRVHKLWLKFRKTGGFDILVAHAPAYSIGDGTDLPHKGFRIFLELMDKYEPMYLVHGHVHASYGSDFQRKASYKNTQIINAYEKYIIDIDDDLITKDRDKLVKKGQGLGRCL